MTFLYFLNCMALTFVPYFIFYKSTLLSDYRAYGSCLLTTVIYALTQLAKIIFLASLFPNTEFSGPISLWNEIVKIITMFGDIIGVLFALKYVGGSGDSKALSVGLGWAIGDSIISNLAEFWMGARGFEFDWKYVRLAIQSNINLPLFLSFVNLVWVWNKTSSKKGNEFDPLLYGILFSYTLLPSIFGILLTLLDPWFVLLFQLLVSGLFFIVVKVLFSHLLPQTFN